MYDVANPALSNPGTMRMPSTGRKSLHGDLVASYQHPTVKEEPESREVSN